jgi:hypothetical protein
MRKLKRLIWMAAFAFLPMSAQTHEIGLGGGGGYYVGDLNPVVHWQAPHPGGTLFYRYNYGNHWSFRGSMVYTSVSAADSVGLFDYQTTRNLSFSSDIFEIHGAVEFNFLPYRPGRNKTNRITPFMFAGLGAFHFNPQANYNGTLVDLATLGTEGQGTGSFPERRRYSRIAAVLPFGLGFKWRFAERWSMQGEWGMRMTLTDYLDDVSTTYANQAELLMVGGQVAVELSDPSIGGYDGPMSKQNYMRGTANDLDWYSFLHLSLVYNIKDKTICYTGGRK